MLGAESKLGISVKGLFVRLTPAVATRVIVA